MPHPRFFVLQDVAIADMDSEQWAELLEMVTDDMQSVPHLALAKAAAASSFPLGPAAKGKSGKVRASASVSLCVFCRDCVHRLCWTNDQQTPTLFFIVLVYTGGSKLKRLRQPGSHDGGAVRSGAC